MMFELGNRMPRITWFRFAFTWGAAAAGAGGAAGEHPTTTTSRTTRDRALSSRIDGTSKKAHAVY
jgi:hypothetical protein